MAGAEDLARLGQGRRRHSDDEEIMSAVGVSGRVVAGVANVDELDGRRWCRGPTPRLVPGADLRDWLDSLFGPRTATGLGLSLRRPRWPAVARARPATGHP